MLSRRRPHPAQHSCFKQDKREVIAIDLRPPQVKFSLSLSRGISLCPVLVEQTEQNVFTVSNFRFFSSRRPVCLHMVLIWIGLGGCVRSYLFVLNEPQRGVDLARGWFLTFPDLCRPYSSLTRRTCHLAARLKWITSRTQSAVFCGVVSQWHHKCPAAYAATICTVLSVGCSAGQIRCKHPRGFT